MRLSLFIVLLVACESHRNGCNGDDSERYAKFLDKSAVCQTISYGDGRDVPDYSRCKVGNEQWFCMSLPGTCFVLDNTVQVQRVK